MQDSFGSRVDGLDPAASGVTGASPESSSFDVSQFHLGIRAIVRQATPGTDTERHGFGGESGTPTGTVAGGWLVAVR